MTRRKQGFRHKTRSVLSKHTRNRGKIRISRYFATFKDGDRVLLQAEPAVQGGMYHPKFHSHVATVLKKKGACYDVEVKEDGKKKVMTVHPVHLRSL